MCVELYIQNFWFKYAHKLKNWAKEKFIAGELTKL